MTTIACNLECMAADRRVSTESGLHYPAAKIFRIGKSLFGTSGAGSMGLVMVEWLKTARNRQQLYRQWADYDRDQIWLIELNPQGIFLWDGWGVPEKVLATRFAVGSGAVAALKGMDKGESPEDAVAAAVDYDIYTGGGVQVEYLDAPPDLTKPKKKRR